MQLMVVDFICGSEQKRFEQLGGCEMKNRNVLAACAAGLVVAACASNSKNIQASYVSPLMYQNLSCKQLGQEAARVSQRAAIASGNQDSKATGDAVKMGVGLVLFWPTLLFMSGDGQTAAEVARLKGEMDAIEQASIQKNCGIVFQTAPPPKPPVKKKR